MIVNSGLELFWKLNLSLFAPKYRHLPRVPRFSSRIKPRGPAFAIGQGVIEMCLVCSVLNLSIKRNAYQVNFILNSPLLFQGSWSLLTVDFCLPMFPLGFKFSASLHIIVFLHLIVFFVVSVGCSCWPLIGRRRVIDPHELKCSQLASSIYTRERTKTPTKLS